MHTLIAALAGALALHCATDFPDVRQNCTSGTIEAACVHTLGSHCAVCVQRRVRHFFFANAAAWAAAITACVHTAFDRPFAMQRLIASTLHCLTPTHARHRGIPPVPIALFLPLRDSRLVVRNDAMGLNAGGHSSSKDWSGVSSSNSSLYKRVASLSARELSPCPCRPQLRASSPSNARVAPDSMARCKSGIARDFRHAIRSTPGTPGPPLTTLRATRSTPQNSTFSQKSTFDVVAN